MANIGGMQESIRSSRTLPPLSMEGDIGVCICSRIFIERAVLLLRQEKAKRRRCQSGWYRGFNISSLTGAGFFYILAGRVTWPGKNSARSNPVGREHGSEGSHGR